MKKEEEKNGKVELKAPLSGVIYAAPIHPTETRDEDMELLDLRFKGAHDDIQADY